MTFLQLIEQIKQEKLLYEIKDWESILAMTSYVVGVGDKQIIESLVEMNFHIEDLNNYKGATKEEFVDFFCHFGVLVEFVKCNDFEIITIDEININIPAYTIYIPNSDNKYIKGVQISLWQRMKRFINI